jgi:hypothetical protein
MQGFTPELLLTLTNDFNTGIRNLSSALEALPSEALTPSTPIAQIIRQVIATVAEKISLLSDPMPWSKEADEALRAYQPARDALERMITHPILRKYCDHIIEISAEHMEQGKGSEFIARVLNSLSIFQNTDLHLSMLGYKLLPLTLEAFKAQAQAYYAITLSSENTDKRFSAQRQLSQYGMLLFKLSKFTSEATEKLKIKTRDEINEMLKLNSPPPGHLRLENFLGGITITSTTSSTKRHHAPPFLREHDSTDSSGTTIPQTVLTLSGSGLSASRSLSPIIPNRESLHRVDSPPSF